MLDLESARTFERHRIAERLRFADRLSKMTSMPRAAATLHPSSAPEGALNAKVSRRSLVVLLAAWAAAPARVRADPSADRHKIVLALIDQVRRNYQDEAAARRLGDALARNLSARAYDDISLSDADFAARLTDDLRRVVPDKHMAVDLAAPGAAPDLTLDPVFSLRQNYGVQEVRRLPGNVGLIELNFAPSLTFGDALLDRYAAAMTLVHDTRALILDVRNHIGGEPAAVAYFVSYFFDRPSFVVNSIRYRAKPVENFYTTATPRGARYGERRPLFVTTSRASFSGAEELAYDLQVTTRARVVGESTGGGANPNEAFDLGGGFVALIPNGAAVNPVTGTNWEGVGVKPDVPVDATKAVDVAQRLALQTALGQASDDDERQSIRQAIDALPK